MNFILASKVCKPGRQIRKCVGRCQFWIAGQCHFECRSIAKPCRRIADLHLQSGARHEEWRHQSHDKIYERYEEVDVHFLQEINIPGGGARLVAEAGQSPKGAINPGRNIRARPNQLGGTSNDSTEKGK